MAKILMFNLGGEYPDVHYTTFTFLCVWKFSLKILEQNKGKENMGVIS